MNKTRATIGSKPVVKGDDGGGAPCAPAAPAFRDEHPLRYSLTNELHARPFEMLTPPMRASMYAAVLGEGGMAAAVSHLEKLCARFGVNPPTEEMSHFSSDFGPFRLRFEKHSEFVSFTCFRSGPFRSPFDQPASSFLPLDWLENMPGQVLVATHLAVLPAAGKDPSPAFLADQFVPESLVTSTLAGGAAQVWTDLRIHADGHNRILVKTRDLPPPKAGRVVQRLLEIATYRNFALLALPVARKIGPKLDRIDDALADLTGEMATGEMTTGEDASPDPRRDADLLTRLTQVSAEIEGLNAKHSYRFAAARAYSALVASRLAELREERHEGYQTLAEFLDRRLTPAMRTCESIEDRLDALSRRATRAANLLRTRVDFLLEQQNQSLLLSMDRRAKLQLRLQQTVEGLSVAAITYYVVGLVGYGAKALTKAGMPLDAAVVQGVSLPVVALGVWHGVHRVRRHLGGDD